MATTTGSLVRNSGAGDCSPFIGRLHVSLAQVSISGCDDLCLNAYVTLCSF